MKNSLYVVYAVLFGAYIGISLPLPLMGPMVLSPDSPFNVAEHLKYFYLSLLLASFPLGNLIGAPILGSVSDHLGRKKILLFGLAGGGFCYALSGVAISQGNMVLLLASRFCCGIFEGNAAIAQSFIANHVSQEAKPRIFGMMVAVISVGYVAGPLVGGVFTNPQLLPFASLALPFYAVSIFIALTMILVAIYFENDGASNHEKHGFLDGLKALVKSQFFARLILLALLLAIGRSLYIDFLASFLSMRFGLVSEQTTWIWVLLAIIWGLAALTTDWGSRQISNQAKLVMATSVAGIMAMFISQSHTIVEFSLLSVVMVTGLALAGTINAVIVSDVAPKAHMGLAMGILSSTYLMGEVVACSIGGGLLKLHESVPFLVSGSMLVLVAIGSMALFYWRRKARASAEHAKVPNNMIRGENLGS